jgi:predicted ArsR family transcriptional regulator
MKTTVYRDEFHDYFIRAGRANQFSYQGRNVLYDWIEQLDADTGEETELDVIALCCEFAESDIQELIFDYGYLMDSEAEKTPEYIRDFLNDHCLVCGEYESESGHTVFVYQQF